MEDILEGIRRSTEAYTRNLPPGEKVAWQRFNTSCQTLANQTRAAAVLSLRQEAERARHHLAERIRPLLIEVDTLATQLAQENAEEAQELVASLAAMRVRTTMLGAGVTLVAVLLSLLVGCRSPGAPAPGAHIREQMAELDRRNQELDSFASRVAHDLISPLAPLKGYLTLAPPLEGGSTDEDAMEMLARPSRAPRGWASWSRRCCASAAPGKPSEAAPRSSTPR